MRYTHIINFKTELAEAETATDVHNILAGMCEAAEVFEDNDVELDTECSNTEAGYLVFVTEDPNIAAEFPKLFEKEGSLWDEDDFTSLDFANNEKE